MSPFDAPLHTPSGVGSVGLPLRGLRVVEVSQVLTGAYAAMVLADLGAEVIKIERPGVGDAARTYGPPDTADTSYYFWSVNRNKRSVELDLRSDPGRAQLAELVADADVLLHNALPSSATALGLDHDVLSAANPRLIHCAINAFGSEGEHADRTALDIVVQAASGMMSITGEPGGAPLRSPVPVVDIAAGLFATTSILAALRDRDTSGRGRAIEVSMLQAAAALMPYHWGAWAVDGRAPVRLGNEHPAMVPYGCYPTADGFVALAVNSDAHWRHLCDALGLAGAGTDVRYATNADRVANRGDVVTLVSAAFATATSAEIVALLAPSGVPCSPVRDLADADHEPRIRFDELDDGCGTGGAPVVASPVRLSGTGYLTARTAAPRLGEHTDEILGSTTPGRGGNR